MGDKEKEEEEKEGEEKKTVMIADKWKHFFLTSAQTSVWWPPGVYKKSHAQNLLPPGPSPENSVQALGALQWSPLKWRGGMITHNSAIVWY